eukprot:CAMPEP_0197826756 /NCGR_PEP_ID=MMETSP1437-20131217/3665_1 /TAXON_ID=49252 ORGANISM="Eucampia antarctica, Strain CCMP1452" /NCGR_SAMPLE_ID=MMETSP1437 /ASSEMBLY_ACC=CAM_ASM_001096 /LENGTH=253 /DNA_ID=CAMNT_0043427331 /DNA_START=162 /DNA_END=923 /DNA_ORIENTATION=-
MSTSSSTGEGVDIESNLAHVRSKITEFETKYNRSENSVRLVAVSKTKPIELLMKAYESGQRRFGENYAQELMGKATEMPSDVEWHFIGPLQSNKAAPLVKKVGLDKLKCIETVSTMKLATKLDRAVETLWVDSPGIKLGIYLQVNTSGEESKSGLNNAAEACALAKEIATECPHLEIQGLMTIGAPKDFTCFDKLVEYRTQVATTVLDVDPQTLELSMGMSGDYEEAIARGTTSVRVGSTIFGNREYSNLTEK